MAGNSMIREQLVYIAWNIFQGACGDAVEWFYVIYNCEPHIRGISTILRKTDSVSVQTELVYIAISQYQCDKSCNNDWL